TERSRQVRSATVYYPLLRIAHHVQHPVQKQGRPVPNRRVGCSVCCLNGFLGSARVSRAGDDVLAIANFTSAWCFGTNLRGAVRPGHASPAGIFRREKPDASRLSMYCPANCRALSSNNGSSPRSPTRLTDVCSFADYLAKIVCCNFCKGLFLK